MHRRHWPNLISASRLALMPAVLGAAVARERELFVALIAFSLLTDAVDGYLARRLRAESEFGRKLDSAADYVTLFTGTTGIALLWPEVVRRELPWILTGVAAFLAVIVLGLIRLGRAPCYHTWASKVGAVLCPLTLIPLLNEGPAWPFRAVILWLVITGIEEVAILLLLPGHVGGMPTLWHAWRRRRAGTGGHIALDSRGSIR
ncbi:MAG: CDP-alcohol phosphatidyltransferase family protein [Verrucomicrobia bacterium]|nr:CDP-alcohol phosphatidyltransferase family protein [Verrucomicrobiota bacterium]